MADKEATAKAHHNLVVAVRALHRSAGMPSSRAISAAVRGRNDLRDTVSHETVSMILRGDGLPKWIKLECVARQLADWATHRPDPDSVVMEIQDLWLACRRVEGDDADKTSRDDEATVQKETAKQRNARSSLLVTSEEASVSYADGSYEITIVRNLVNHGSDPVTEYPVRVFVNRYPEEPERSKRHHQQNPLTWSELAFEGWCGRRPMAWRSSLDRESAKAMTLMFANEEASFPLLPGEACELSYSYRVGDDKWGPWFSRHIYFATQRLIVTAEFPTRFRPIVWGERVSPLMDDPPVRTPLSSQSVGPGRIRFRWALNEVLLRTTYRLQWGFRSPPPTGAVAV